MKNILKKITVIILSLPVRIILFRKRPQVIAITGSAGKTTTKEFIKKLLEIDYHVLSPMEGYNTEIGAPLGIFEEKTPTKVFSLVGWLKIIFRIYSKALFMKNFPEKVVVEMGADKPGDIKHLCSLFKPQLGVILTVLPVHLADFKTVEAVATEKSELAKAIGEKGKLFLNFDDPRVREMGQLTKGKVIYFGNKSDGHEGYFAKELRADLGGINFKLFNNGKEMAFTAPLFGQHIIYPLLASISVALEENISAFEIKKAVAKLRPFKGRMNIIEGINDSIIIDDSYNANPKSMIRALEFLAKTKGRKIAALGTMNELGSYEKSGHEEVGRVAAKVADIIVTVGEPAEKYLAHGALEAGFNESALKSFLTSDEAGDYLKKIVKEGDVILAKGSQNKVRMEMAVKKIMKNPKRAEELLVRQSAFWK